MLVFIWLVVWEKFNQARTLLKPRLRTAVPLHNWPRCAKQNRFKLLLFVAFFSRAYSNSFARANTTLRNSFRPDAILA